MLSYSNKKSHVYLCEVKRTRSVRGIGTVSGARVSWCIGDATLFGTALKLLLTRLGKYAEVVSWSMSIIFVGVVLTCVEEDPCCLLHDACHVLVREVLGVVS